MPSETPDSNSHALLHTLICDIVEVGSKVLDLGCGEGDLLHELKQKKNTQGTGVEVSGEKVYQCIRKGLAVHHGDIDQGLEDFPNKSFDYVILSETLQEVRKPYIVIKEMLRVARKGIISFPNFGYWRARVQLGLLGKAPVTENLPYEWYEGPNIQFFTIKDFHQFCRKENITIVNSFYIHKNKQINFMPNLFADFALCVIE